MEDIERFVVGIVGTGLIGTSLALALKNRDPEQSILGCDTDEIHARQAAERGAFDGIEEHPLALAEHCDILVVATPVGAICSIFEQIKEAAERIVITDVGSVKRSVIADACSVWGNVPTRMVPAHPIAGTENSGPATASEDLFVSRYVFLTPEPHADEVAMNTVRALWCKAGAKIEVLIGKTARRIICGNEPLAAYRRLCINKFARASRCKNRFFRRWFERFHAHRSQRSDDVARYIYCQRRPRAPSHKSLREKHVFDTQADRKQTRRPVASITRKNGRRKEKFESQRLTPSLCIVLLNM